MAESKVILNPEALNHLLKGRDGLVYKDLVRRCLIVTAGAKRRCPVKTGRLRASIRYRVDSSGKDGSPQGFVGSDVQYSSFVENGTKFMEPRHFLADALGDLKGV